MLSPSRELEQNYRSGRSAEILTFPVPASDTGLVAALRSEHPEARRVLCERYSGGLLRVASRILGPDPGVRSVVVETLRWALSHLHELDDARALGTWLNRRLVVLARRRLMSKRILRGITDWGGANWSDTERASEQLTATYRVLDHLSVDQRLAFCLVVIDSMRWAEAAAVLGCPPALIKAKLIAAHAVLRDIVRSRFPQLLRWHSTIAQLVVDLAAEQDRRLADVSIYDFELLPTRTDRFKPRLLAVPAALCTLFIVCFACVKLWASPAHRTESVGVGTWVVAPPRQPTTIPFSNGSRITLAPGSRLRVLTSAEFGDASVLESGAVTLTINTQSESNALVAAGPFLVSANRGTTELSWAATDESLKVVVHQGVATISGCQFGMGTIVEHGRSVDARCITPSTFEGLEHAVAGAQLSSVVISPDPS